MQNYSSKFKENYFLCVKQNKFDQILNTLISCSFILRKNCVPLVAVCSADHHKQLDGD